MSFFFLLFNECVLMDCEEDTLELELLLMFLRASFFSLSLVNVNKNQCWFLRQRILFSFVFINMYTKRKKKQINVESVVRNYHRQFVDNNWHRNVDQYIADENVFCFLTKD